MRTVRAVIGTLLGVVSLVAGLAYLPAVWLHENLVTSAGFNQVVQPLSQDPAIHEDLSESAVAEISGALNLPSFMEQEVSTLVTDGVSRAADTPEYQQVWNQTMQDMHTDMVAGTTARIRPNFAPVLDGIVKPLEDFAGLDIPTPPTIQPTVATFDASFMTKVQALTENRQWLLVAAIAGFVLMIVINPARGTSLFLYGLMAALASAGLWAVVMNLPILQPASITNRPFLGPIVTAFEEKAAVDIMPAFYGGLGLGVALMILGIVVGLVTRSARRPRDAY